MAAVAAAAAPLTRSPEAEAGLLALSLDGFCVLPSAIPAALVQQVRDSALSDIKRREAAGHAGNLAGNSTFINVNQAAAPYFANRRVLDVVEGCFGPVPHTRIGCTSCVVHETEPDEAQRRKLSPVRFSGAILRAAAIDHAYDGAARTDQHGRAAL